MRYELSDYEWTAIKPMLPNGRGARRLAAFKLFEKTHRAGFRSRGRCTGRPTRKSPIARSIACSVRSDDISI